MKSWTAEQIRELRHRLGWCTADLARHFSCTPEHIQKWERGELFPSPEETLILEDLSICVESLSRRVREWSLADSTLDDGALDQVHLDQVGRPAIKN